MITKQFPLLLRKFNGKKLAYLDNAATTQKPQSVILAISNYYTKTNANVHRGFYQLAEEATEAYENARQIVAKFLGADNSREIIFTRNATEAINLVAQSWGSKFLHRGDEIILSVMEHHSNLVPWQELAKKHGVKIKFIPLTKIGELDYLAYEKLLSKKVKLVSVVHVSNVLGTINNIERIVGKAKTVGARVLLDAAQSVAHQKIDVKKLGVDFLVLSGHKMYGPTGIGVLWAKAEILDVMPPFLFGGEMIKSVSLTSAIWNELPYKFEAGTPNVAGAIGLATAVLFIKKVGLAKIKKHEDQLTAYALKKLSQVPNLKIYGPRKRGPVIAFSHATIHAHDLAQILDQTVGVAVRAGSHCTMPLHQALGTPATARVSFAVYNTKAEVDLLIKGLAQAEKILKF